MRYSSKIRSRVSKRPQSGFTLIELMTAVTILLAISSMMTLIIIRMSKSHFTVANRTDMHASVRSATELLQQEVGQAGRIALPSPATITSPPTISQAVVNNVAAQTVNVSSAAGFFAGEIFSVGPDTTNGASREVVQITAVNTGVTPNTITAIFNDNHASGAPLAPLGVFSGVIPPYDAAECLNQATHNGGTACEMTIFNTGTQKPDSILLTAAAGTYPGSTTTLLKMYGDINDDGNMVYIEYSCTAGTPAAPGTFSRRVIPYNTALAKTTANFPWTVLLSNVLANPGATPCFSYQTKSFGNNTYVINVAITLTVQTQNKNSEKQDKNLANAFDTETKALLNISPRNVFEAYQMASLVGGTATRIQPIPTTVLNLLNP